MPWYNRYFFHIFYGTVAMIVGISAFQMNKSIKQSKKKQVIQQRQYKDSI